MSFLDNIGDKFNKLGKKSGDVVEAAKLKVELTKLNSEINKNKDKLGEVVYSLYLDEKEDKETVFKLCSEIKRLEDEVASLEKVISKLMNTSTKCPQCENKIPAGSKFCNNCGYKVEEIEQQIEMEIEDELEIKTCSNCENELSEDDKFCDNCGTPVKANETIE